MGSGGPAGTFDHVETARSALPIGASVRVRVTVTESMSNFSKGTKFKVRKVGRSERKNEWWLFELSGENHGRRNGVLRVKAAGPTRPDPTAVDR
jgi:hypothetical protein